MLGCKVSVNALKFNAGDDNKIITAVKGGGYRIASEDFECKDVFADTIEDVIEYLKNLSK